MTEKRDKVNVEDIIGLIKTDEPTNSVEEVRKLRGREDNNFYWYKKYKEVLNENEALKQRITTQSVDREQLCKRIDEVRRENEQLKSEIKDLNDILARYEEKELQE